MCLREDEFVTSSRTSLTSASTFSLNFKVELAQSLKSGRFHAPVFSF